MDATDLSRAWHSTHEGNAHGGALVCHGFTGTPFSMRPWAEHLADAGWDVELPLLPGHGTTWQDMARTRWPDWYGAVRAAARRLLERHDTLVVAGLSMGGSLTLRLAEDPEFSERIRAIALVNPAATLSRPVAMAIPVLGRVIPSLAAIGGDIKRPGPVEGAYDRTPLRSVEELRLLLRGMRRGLDRVTCPVLLATSTEDHTVDPRDSDLIAARVQGPVQRLALEDSYHVATLDNDAALLQDVSADFFARHARAS